MESSSSREADSSSHDGGFSIEVVDVGGTTVWERKRGLVHRPWCGLPSDDEDEDVGWEEVGWKHTTEDGCVTSDRAAIRTLNTTDVVEVVASRVISFLPNIPKERVLK